MKQVIDLDSWNRKEHYLFYSSFDDPFFGITTKIDFTKVYERSKNSGCSFFLYSLHFLMKCVNSTDAFKLRIENGHVVKYDSINVSPTIGRDDGTFGFGYFKYYEDINQFVEKARLEIERVKNITGLSFTENENNPDVVYYSALPWFSFSEIKHASSFKNGDSVPRLTTGKLSFENGIYILPISISAHHGLVDGRDVADLVRKLSGE